MRALLFFLVVSAHAQVVSLTVLGYDPAGKRICSDNGLLSNEPGVVQVSRPCFLKAQRVTALTPLGAELPFSAVKGDNVAQGKLLLAFELPKAGKEMLFSMQPVQVLTRAPQTLAEWQASVDPIAERYVVGSLKSPAPVALLRQALARKPKFAEAWFLLAQAYEKAGNRPETIKALEKVVEIEPLHVPAAKLLVHSYLLEKRILEAQALMLDMRKTSPFVSSQLETAINLFKLENEISGAMLPGQPLKSPQ